LSLEGREISVKLRQKTQQTLDVPLREKNMWTKLLQVSDFASISAASASYKRSKENVTKFCSNNMKGRKGILETDTTFQSPARGPSTTPASITSMQTKGWWRLGALFRAWALANFKISNASPRGSNLSVL